MNSRWPFCMLHALVTCRIKDNLFIQWFIYGNLHHLISCYFYVDELQRNQSGTIRNRASGECVVMDCCVNRSNVQVVVWVKPGETAPDIRVLLINFKGRTVLYIEANLVTE